MVCGASDPEEETRIHSLGVPLCPISLDLLNELNDFDLEVNRQNLDQLGGVDGLLQMLSVTPDRGLDSDQVLQMRSDFGANEFPASPFASYLDLLIGALSDTTLLILLAAAAVSFGIGYWQDPSSGWVDGAAIFVAVFLVSNIAAMSDYSKQLQFLELEKTSEEDQRVSVLRDGRVQRLNPREVVVGDILVLQVTFHCSISLPYVINQFPRRVTLSRLMRFSVTTPWSSATSQL